VRATLGTDDRSQVAVVVPGNAERLILAEQGGSPTFVAGDQPDVRHVLYGESGRLMALPFDAGRRIVTGGAVPILENVAMRGNGDLADYTVSSTGTLVCEVGGSTLAQDEESCVIASMPRAAAPFAQRILPITEIGDEIARQAVLQARARPT
jgi:hypothetical protein